MAIVVEEERHSSVNIIGAMMWGLVLVAIGLSAYYLFFKRPELIPITVPANFENAESLSNIQLNPEEVLDNPTFKALKTLVNPVKPEGVGKTNPLLGF